MAKGNGEFWHTIRGPVMSILTALALAAIFWALNYKAGKQEIYDKLQRHDERIGIIETKFDAHCTAQQEMDIKLAETLGEIKTEIKNLNRNLRRGQ